MARMSQSLLVVFDESGARLLDHFLVNLRYSFALFAQQLPCFVLLMLEASLRHLGCNLRACFVCRAQDVASIESIIRLRCVVCLLLSHGCCWRNNPSLGSRLHECNELSRLHLRHLVYA